MANAAIQIRRERQRQLSTIAWAALGQVRFPTVNTSVVAPMCSSTHHIVYELSYPTP